MEKSNVEVIDELKNEVSRLKSTIGGYKKANKDYRSEIKRANETIRTKSAIIEAFQKKCDGLSAENKALIDKVASLNDALAESEKTIAKLRTPWWKRIF